MSWKECGRKQSWSNLRMLPQDLPGGTEENHKELQSRQSLSQLTSESSTSKMQIRSITTSPTLLGISAIMIFLIRQNNYLHHCLHYAAQQICDGVEKRGHPDQCYSQAIRVLEKVHEHLLIQEASPTYNVNVRDKEELQSGQIFYFFFL